MNNIQKNISDVPYPDNPISYLSLPITEKNHIKEKYKEKYTFTREFFSGNMHFIKACSDFNLRDKIRRELNVYKVMTHFSFKKIGDSIYVECEVC